VSLSSDWRLFGIGYLVVKPLPTNKQTNKQTGTKLVHCRHWELLLGSCCWGAVVGGLLSGSCCWGAVVGGLLLGSCCWGVVVVGLLSGSCCWGAVLGELFSGCCGDATVGSL
jgi:hypothetical protein